MELAVLDCFKCDLSPAFEPFRCQLGNLLMKWQIKATRRRNSLKNWCSRHADSFWAEARNTQKS